MAIVSTVLASVAFFAGLRRVGPATAATVSTVEPAVTVALDALIFGAPVTWYLAIGGSLILAAVVLLARAGGEPERDISLRPVPGA
jgi:drug/metabolite transporter (DMT)-like permease